MSLRRAKSAASQTVPPPIPPTVPFISLPDRHLSNHFTKERVRKHLLRAGLLTKDGYIVTEAEYASKQTDIAIGHNNRRKRDDAILEVLHELGEEHNKLLNNRLKAVQYDLQWEFRRIERQYSRRKQPITIKVTHEGQVEQMSTTASKSSDGNERKSHTTTDLSRFPSISASAKFSKELENIRQKLDELTRHQSMLELKLNTAQAAGRSLKEHTDFRQKLNELTHNQSMLEQRLDSLKMSNSSNAHLWTIQHTVDKLKKNQDTIEKKYETRSQTGEDDENELNQVIDQQQIEQLIHKSTDIKNLYANITNIHNLLAATPASLTQADIDAAIASSEQRIIEKMAHINNTKPAIKPSEPKNEDPKTSDQAVNDRITRLEKRLDDLSKSISSFVTRPTIDDLIRDAIANSKPTTSQTVISPQPDISLQNRIALIEERLGTFSLVKDLDEIKLRLKKIENSANDHIHHVPLVEHAPSPSVAQSIPTHRPNVDDPRMTSLEKQVNDHTSFLYELREQINVLERTKIVHSEASQLVNASEERIKQAMNNLPKCVHRECQDARLPDVINRINSHSTVIQTLSQQINVLDGNKPDLKIVEKLIKDNVKQGKGTKAVSADGNERYDPRISGLQEQLNTHLELIHSLEKQLEQLVQQFISKCERPASDLSDILQKIHNHTIAIQDLNDRMNQLPNIQSNDELRRKVDDIDREVKRAHKELADLRRKLAQQSTSTSQPSPPLPPGKDSSAKQHTDEDYQAIMPFIEVLPTYNLFADNEWD